MEFSGARMIYIVILKQFKKRAEARGILVVFASERRSSVIDCRYLQRGRLKGHLFICVCSSACCRDINAATNLPLCIISPQFLANSTGFRSCLQLQGILLRGITPKSMLDEWSSVFRSPKSIAQTVIHKFVGFLEAQASELIWKPRCSATIAWEQAQGISAKAKVTKYTGPRGVWTRGYGYITRDGYCPCGASLATHEDGLCPGTSLDPRAADERLLQSLLGRRRLTLMERMGRVPFIRA
ncbi:MAG: hypothetical protein JOS17DRAFT_840292 [Linnemannia elongata]|nr:MAG: hypothetical protein JOS17DRAFT_840292 [Linnemannia elongata]